MLYGEQYMAEEIPFKSIKITLSEEAISKLAELRQGGAFRSDSATIEECIRFVSDVFDELLAEIERSFKGKEPMPLHTQAELLRRIVLRLARFGKAMPPIVTS